MLSVGGRVSCGTLGVNRNADRILVVKTKEERFLGRLKHKLYDSTKTDLKKIGTERWAGDIWLRDKRWAEQLSASELGFCSMQLVLKRCFTLPTPDNVTKNGMPFYRFLWYRQTQPHGCGRQSFTDS